jgi:bifunctional non-homologous end joining protein LigD
MPKSAKQRESPIFVVQKHNATRLHYDFRLEVGGTLKSWAIPKGPSLDPAQKRLAVMVEDHSLGYADFEGNLPEGTYGAGEVIVWDTGEYLAEGDMRQGLKAGRLGFTLKGKKLKGGWTMVRLKRDPKSWLLIKADDRYADREKDVLEDGRSVLSKRTIENLEEAA